MKKSVFVSLGALALALNASAQDSSRLVKGVTMADMQEVVTNLGHTVETTSNPDKQVTAITPDGLKYSLNGTVCDDGPCLGIQMVLTYDMNTPFTADHMLEANMTYSAAKVWGDEDSLAISRYLILDGGMTIENIGINVTTLVSLGPLVLSKVQEVSGVTQTAETVDGMPANFDFGDDSGSDGNDGVCDDGRFHSDGDNYTYTRAHVMRDATDCRAAVADGIKSLTLDFGDNSGDYTDDGTCDDNRFTGEGRSFLTTDSQVKRDAADCIAAYQAGTIERP